MDMIDEILKDRASIKVTQRFEDIPVGQKFICNMNLYSKRSTRTARLLKYDRTFYFSMSDSCQPVYWSIALQKYVTVPTR